MAHLYPKRIGSELNHLLEFMGTHQSEQPLADLLILVAVLLPPQTLDIFGTLVEERVVETPYGAVMPLGLRRPASGPAVWVQPYTGSPHRTDPRATIYAAQELGVHYVLNWDTGIVVNPVLRRGQNGIAVDFIDWTRHLPHTFGRDIRQDKVNERYLRPPTFCPHMIKTLFQIFPDAVGVTYLGVDGPRRETPAEARLFRQMGGDVVGQNLVPEVSLAQELGICYAGLITLGERSADQLTMPPHGEMRAGMEQIIRALPDYVNLLGALPTCNNNHS